MADLFFRSASGSGSNDGASWATAKASCVSSSLTPGGTFYLASDHYETATFVGFSSTSTPAAFFRIISATYGESPPAHVVYGAIISAQMSLTLAGYGEVWGVRFIVGAGYGNAATLYLGSGAGVLRCRSCRFESASTAGGSSIRVPGGNTTRAFWHDCDVKVANTNDYLDVYGEFTWIGGSFDGAGATPVGNGLITARTGALVKVIGVDFSGLSASLALVRAIGASKVVFIGAKLPSGWNGPLLFGTLPAGARVEMHACDDGTSVARTQVAELSGSLYSDTAVKRNASASPVTWRIVKAANVDVFDAIDIAVPVDAGTHTLSVEVLTDGVTLSDTDCWLEAKHPGGAVALYAAVSDFGGAFSTAAQDTSDAAWSTPGIATPVRQRLTVTFTTARAGVVIATVRVARASTTVYVDPDVVLS